MSDPFKELVEQLARLSLPEDDTEDNREMRQIAASESGTPISELDESDLIACVDDEFLCSEADHRQEVSNGTDRVRVRQLAQQFHIRFVLHVATSRDAWRAGGCQVWAAQSANVSAVSARTIAFEEQWLYDCVWALFAAT